MIKFKCWLLKKKLYEFAIEELINSDAKKIKKHLNECSQCRQYVSQIQKIVKTSHQQEQPFFNEVFWRKFDERLDLAIAGEGMGKTGPNIRLIPRPMPRLSLAAVMVACLLIVFALTPIKSYFTSKGDIALVDKELIETALLVEDETEIYLNSDEDAYIEEMILQLELDDA